MKTILFFIILLLKPAFISAITYNNNLLEDHHAVYLTESPDETTEWKFRLIQEAKSSLEISTGYCLGCVFDRLLHEVHRKLIENPTIKIHMHMFQILGFINEEHISFLEGLKCNYKNRFYYVITTDSELLAQEGRIYISENHTKLIIVDEKYFLLGGTNLVDALSSKDKNKYPIANNVTGQFFPLAAYDMDAIIRGNMAKKLRKEFFQLFSLHEAGETVKGEAGEYIPKSTRYFPIDKENQALIIDFEENPETEHEAKVFSVISGPRIQSHTIGNIYEYLITHSKVSIDIGNMYFFPRKSIYDALLDASCRNVSISITTNGMNQTVSTNNSSIDLYAYINRMNYFPVMAGRHYRMWEIFSSPNADRGNTEIYELNLQSVLYHKKVMTVDNQYSIIGSYNLGMKSEDAAFEVAAIIESPKIASKMKAILLEDQAHSTQIPFTRALGWYFNPYYNIVEILERRFIDGILAHHNNCFSATHLG